MKRIIKLNNNNLLISCNIKEYDEIIENRIMMFDDANDYNNSIIINEDKTVVKMNNNSITIKGRLLHTDLYQLINNIISNLINDENNIYIHSCVITKNNKTILILGDFHSGKTTLAMKSLEYGYNIISADQSWLRYDEDLKIYKGSLYLAFKNNYKIIEKITKEYKIDYIYILQNINNGIINIFNSENVYRQIKSITKYCTWSTNNVLMTDEVELKLDKKIVNKFIKKINIPVKYVFGNVEEIIKEMEDKK